MVFQTQYGLCLKYIFRIRKKLGSVLQQLLGIKNYAEETHAKEKKTHKRLLNRVLALPRSPI